MRGIQSLIVHSFYLQSHPIWWRPVRMWRKCLPYFIIGCGKQEVARKMVKQGIKTFKNLNNCIEKGEKCSIKKSKHVPLNRTTFITPFYHAIEKKFTKKTKKTEVKDKHLLPQHWISQLKPNAIKWSFFKFVNSLDAANIPATAVFKFHFRAFLAEKAIRRASFYRSLVKFVSWKTSSLWKKGDEIYFSLSIISVLRWNDWPKSEISNICHVAKTHTSFKSGFSRKYDFQKCLRH